MGLLVQNPTPVVAVGTPGKQIGEYVGQASTGTGGLSIAVMDSPQGWAEPGQRPQFDEYTLVLRGSVRIQTEAGVTDVREGELYIARAGDWVRYSTPEEGGARYLAVCQPAFSPSTVHRDPERP